MSFLSSILGSVGSSALDVVGNLISTKYANDLNMKNWHAQMDYNAPVNQLKRLREAGLNPNLIYGSGGVQNTITAAPKMDAPDGRLNLLSNYQQILNGEKQRELMDSQISKNEAEEDSALIHSVGMILDNIGKKFENDYREYELDYLKTKGTIRGQNMINGLLDRIEDMSVKAADMVGSFDPVVKLEELKGHVKDSIKSLPGTIWSYMRRKASDYWSYRQKKARERLAKIARVNKM